jgi:hypothetical protein
MPGMSECWKSEVAGRAEHDDNGGPPENFVLQNATKGVFESI